MGFTPPSGGASSGSIDELKELIATETAAREDADTSLAEMIAEAEYTHFETADTVPTAETAQNNVLYLVKNSTTGYYDIYALVGDTVELLDDTTVDLSGYATAADVAEAADTAAAAQETADEALEAANDTATDEEMAEVIYEVLGIEVE